MLSSFLDAARFADLTNDPVIVRDPYRWCSVASDAPQGVCATPAADAETYQRTKTVVESMGAATAGAHELLITKEK